jgi:hypothetical protein
MAVALELVHEKTENDNGVESTIKIFKKNNMVVGKGEYIKDTKTCNCDVSIFLSDIMDYAQFIDIHSATVIYINDFVCFECKGYGKKLLFEVLEFIRSEKGPDTMVTLLAASKERVVDEKKIAGDDNSLISYYSRLGFIRIRKVPGAMYGNIEAIMRNCSPDKFKAVRERSRSPEAKAAAAATAAAATAAAPMPTRPAPEAVFSDGSVAPLDSDFDSSSDGSVSVNHNPVSKVQADTRHVSSTSVDRRVGGKINHTNKKYTIKTRKNKNKKSKKRWSLKYKKSINCKRHRKFSQHRS